MVDGAPAVGADPARVQRVRRGVDRDPGRVAHTHHIDLAAGLPAALVRLLAGEEVAGRQGVCAVVLRVDPQDLPVEVVGVARGAPRVGEADALVVRLRVVAGVTTAEAGGVVVTGRDVQVVLRVPRHAAARVAAAVDLHRPAEQHLLRCQVQLAGRGVEGEAGDLTGRHALVAVDLRVRGVVQIHPPVGREVRVQLDAEQPLLDLDQFVAAALVAEDVQRTRQGDLLRLRVVDVDLALALADVRVVPVDDDRDGAVGPAAPDVEDPPVGRGHQTVRLADLVVLTRLVGLGQALGGVVGGDRRLAVGLRGPVRPGEGAAQMVAEVGLREAVRRAAHGRVEGPAAVVVAAPGDRVVPAVGARARLVRQLPYARHGVHVTGRVLRPVQPLVGALPLQRQALGGRVDPIADLDGRPLHRSRAVRRGTRSDQSGEPVRVRLGPRRVMDAEETAAGLHVGLQARFLLRVEDVAPAGQEDDGVERAEPLAVGEDLRVGRGHGREPAGLRAAQPDLLDRRDAGCPCTVPRRPPRRGRPAP